MLHYSVSLTIQKQNNMKHLNMEQNNFCKKLADEIVNDVRTRVYNQKFLLSDAVDNDLVRAIWGNTFLIVCQELSNSIIQ